MNRVGVKAVGACAIAVMGCTMLTTPASAAVPTDGKAELNDYISGLSYDKNQILTFQGEKVTNVPPTEGQQQNGQFVVLSREKKSLSNPTVDIAAISSNADKTYPGAILQANGGLVENSPTLVSAGRAPETISVDLPGMAGKNSTVVKQPSNSSVQSGINTLLERWNADNAPSYPNIPARIQYDKSMAYSMSQLKAKFGSSFTKLAAPLNIDFSAVASGKKQVEIVNFRQIYYTVSVDAPNKPADVFAPDVTPADLKKRGVTSETPPVYVSNVSYGRSMYVKLETDSKSEKVQEAFDVAFKGGEAHADTEVKNILKNTSFSAVVLGGDAGDATKAVSGNMDDLQKVIQKGSRYGRLNPGVPISYTTSFLKDNAPATIQNYSEYVETKARAYDSGELKLDHKGAYVARFFVDWDEVSYDEAGKEVLTPRHWSENGKSKTAHFSTSIHLNGNVRNLRVKINECTGLAWEWWRTVYDKQDLPLVKARTIKIGGTTLHPSVSDEVSP
ncbi:alveolysin [Streptomyces solincola]|uniref:Alveolysin n=1 Tax=Streptomyces solincola TaxID=2100817 RepID=A0A2S9PZJ1_9ACTN|nr:thiol-activated cytolysin family protein [Streptomyces solincola]PRH79841.1 alveolysin [Streptomyces solincola]